MHLVCTAHDALVSARLGESKCTFRRVRGACLFGTKTTEGTESAANRSAQKPVRYSRYTVMGGTVPGMTHIPDQYSHYHTPDGWGVQPLPYARAGGGNSTTIRRAGGEALWGDAWRRIRPLRGLHAGT